MSLTVSNTIIAICMMIITLSIIAFVVGVLVAMFKIRGMVDRTLKDAKPAMNQAAETMRTVSDVARTVQSRVDHIMHIAEETADNVSRKVKTTSSMITETIAPPLISVSSLVTGVSRGLEIWNTMKKQGGNGHGTRE
jgi:uncharacterized protein YneF (UPF0154 family)